jgi:hypothetical protein
MEGLAYRSGAGPHDHPAPPEPRHGHLPRGHQVAEGADGYTLDDVHDTHVIIRQLRADIVREADCLCEEAVAPCAPASTKFPKIGTN